jgi:hypothetical protein
MAEKANPDGAMKLKTELATLTTFWANNQTTPKADEGQMRSPQALPTKVSSGEDSKEKAERKRKRKKEAPEEAIRPVHFLSMGRMVPGPREEYGKEDYVLLLDVFGDMTKKQCKQPLKPSLPLHKEAGPQEREKPAKELASFKARISGIEEGRRGLHEPRQKEKSWADQMEEDEAEAERARAEIEEDRRTWRARLHEEEVSNLDAPSGKTVMELLAEKEAQRARAEPPKAGISPLGERLGKTAPPKGVSPSLKTGKEQESAPDEAMEMALKIKDPAIQARVTRVLNTTCHGSTGSKESGSTTEEDEEERVSAKAERARKKEERVEKKNRKEKGIKRGDSQVSGKEPDTKVID